MTIEETKATSKSELTEESKMTEKTKPTDEQKRANKDKLKNISLKMTEPKQKPSFIRVMICIFISLVLASGGMFGMVSAIRGARALVKYDHVSLDEGTINYFAAYYKQEYMRNMRIVGVDAKDTDEFWQSKTPAGETYGENFEKSFREYLSSLVAAANIYLNHAKYTAEDKVAVTKTVEEILKFKAEGSVDRFNEMAEKYHFDYDDFHNAAAILYKADRASEVIYGTDGKNLANFPSLCDEYLQNYAHVSLLFVKINDTMTDEEKAEKHQIINTLSAAIDAKNNGGGTPITEAMFNDFLKDSDGDPTMHSRGYYFRRGAEKTAEFYTAFPEVVDAAIDMQIGEFKMVECLVGVCFIYKSEPVSGAYTDNSNVFFSDFYQDASAHHYKNTLKALACEVKFTSRYERLSPAEIPVISDFIIREFKNTSTDK